MLFQHCPPTTALFQMLVLTPSRAVGVPEGNVGSVSSQLGSSSHLPPYSSQPDPYPQSSLAQQARCLILARKDSCWGVWRCWEGDKGREDPGSSTARPFDLVPGLAGPNGPRQTALSAPRRRLLLLFYQLPRPQGLTERQKGGGVVVARGGGGQMNTIKRLTQSTPSPPLLLSPPFISGSGSVFPRGQAAAPSSPV